MRKMPWAQRRIAERHISWAPPNACDCHQHIYDARYPVDPKAVLRPGDALGEEYRAFQRRIGTSRNVVVRPSTYGIDNRVMLHLVVKI